MSHRPYSNRGWLGFWVHFFFGAVLGGLIGLGAYTHSSYVGSSSAFPMFAFIAAGALIIGLVAGCYGDELWSNIRKL